VLDKNKIFGIIDNRDKEARKYRKACTEESIPWGYPKEVGSLNKGFPETLTVELV